MPFHEDGSEYDIQELIQAAGMRIQRNKPRATGRTNTTVRRRYTSYQGYTGPVRVTVPWKSQVSEYMRQKIAERTLTVKFEELPQPPDRTKPQWFVRHGSLR